MPPSRLSFAACCPLTGRFYVAAGTHILVYTADGSFVQEVHTQLPAEDALLGLACDAQGSLYIATVTKVRVLNASFKYLRNVNVTTKATAASSFSLDRDGHFWFGDPVQGLMQLDGKYGTDLRRLQPLLKRDGSLASSSEQAAVLPFLGVVVTRDGTVFAATSCSVLAFREKEIACWPAGTRLGGIALSSSANEDQILVGGHERAYWLKAVA